MKDEQGYTVIETVVCTVVLAIMIIGLYMVFMSGTRSWVSEESILDAQKVARQALRGTERGDWRGMAAEIRTLHKIIGPFPDDTATATTLSNYKLRFIGETCIFAGNNRIVETLRRTGFDDVQLIGTGTIVSGNNTIIITAGLDGILQSVPGDINGDGTAEAPGWDDYTDALIIDGNDGACDTQQDVNDQEEFECSSPPCTCGKGDILVSPGDDNRLQTLPIGDDFRGGPPIIGYEFKDNKIYRTINDKPTDPSKGHTGPYVVSKNIESLNFCYLQSDGLTEVLPGLVSQTMLSTITQIELVGTVAITKKTGEIIRAPFKTRIQPRALNSYYVMGQ